MGHLKKIILELFIINLSVLVLSSGVHAGGVTFNVTRTDDPTPGPCDGDCSLREAILDSNFQVSADNNVINLQAGAVYNLSRTGAADDTGSNGDLDIFWDTLSSGALTINGNGARIDATLINERVLDVPSGGVNLTLNDLTLTGGLESGSGGGLQFSGTGTNSTLMLNRCSVADNEAASGGGISAFNGTAILNASTLSINHASGSGGGVAISSATLKLNNSTISTNTAGAGGGGINVSLGNATIRSSTIFANEAGTQGGGINVVEATVNIKNSILSGNSATGGDPDCFGSFFSLVSNGYNIFGNFAGSCVPSGPQTDDQPGITNPQLGSLANNGGPTLTHAPLAGSQALDHGDPAGCQDADDMALATDQRGEERQADGDGNGSAVCDVGSFEVVCGDDFTSGEEECDDGNATDGDCCSATCSFESSSSSCDDGNSGTTDDQCNGAGLCEGTPIVSGDNDGGCALGASESAQDSLLMFLILGSAISGLLVWRHRRNSKPDVS